MRIVRLGAAILSVLLLGPASADCDEGELRRHVDAYFRDFNEIRTPEYLADTYLSSPLMILSSAGVRKLDSMKDVEEWLRQTQSTLKQAGWMRSDLLDARVCMAAENVALFSMKLARVGRSESTTIGATYILFKSDRWRIVTIMIANPDRLLRCDSPD